MIKDNRPKNKAGLKILFSYKDFPLIVVGPSCKYWIYYLLIIGFPRIFLILIYFSFLMFMDSHFHYIYVVLNILLRIFSNHFLNYVSLISFLFVCFANPGIIDIKKYFVDDINEKYQGLDRFRCCIKCNIYLPEPIKYEHCQHCGRCIFDKSHHSSIFGKCIGKYNYYSYYIFILSIVFHSPRILTYIFSPMLDKFIRSYLN